MSNSSIWLVDKTLSEAIILGQSGSGKNGNEGVLHIPQSSSITGALASDCLLSYAGHSLSVCVCGGSNPSVEMQSVYSTAPAKWAMELWVMWSTPPLPWFLSVLSMGQIEIFNHLLYLKPFNCVQPIAVLETI